MRWLVVLAAGWLVGALLCLTPGTAILAQGWLVGRMRRIALQKARARPGASPGWAPEDPSLSKGLLGRMLGVARLGVEASLAIFLGFLPLTALLLFSWWGGWENSFNKGYEQSWVGPTLALVGAAVGLPLLARAPLALAHLAVEGRMAAFFQRRAVGRLMMFAGWEQLALAAAFVLAALPLLAAKGLPVFIEKIHPGFEALGEEEVARFAFLWRLGCAFYLFAALWFLRGWSARLYAKARLRAEASQLRRTGAAVVIGAWLRRLLLWAIWAFFLAQIYIGQFLNHRWIEWLNPPLAALPAAPGLGG